VGSSLNRLNSYRKNASLLSSFFQSPSSLFLPFYRLKPLVKLENKLLEIRWKPLSECNSLQESDSILLGQFNQHYYYVYEEKEERKLIDNENYMDLRSLLPFLKFEDSAFLSHGRALIEWQSRHRFCGVCGSPTFSAEGSMEPLVLFRLLTSA